MLLNIFGSTINVTYFDECLPLSTNQLEENDTIVLYPNPSNEIVNIKSKSTLLKIYVYDTLGKKLFEFMPNQLNFSFNINFPGLYILRVESEMGIKNFKVIIK